MKKLLPLILLPLCLFMFKASAQDAKEYPNIAGKVLFETRVDRVLSSEKQVDKNNGIVNFEPYFWLNMNKNWSVQTSWKFDRMIKRKDNQAHPERYRTILSDNRKIETSDQVLIVEQLKGQFQNEDMKFFFGKFNPSFGTAWRKEKRIGVFTTDFTKDYELREKIGLGVSAILENSEITINSFFNDNTNLSNSAINKRGRDNNKNLAGSTSSLSSYSATIEGQDFIGVKDLFYNAGYRDLAVKGAPGFENEKGFTAGLEYLIPIGLKTSLIPFIEAAKINNLSGIKGRNALYTTAALIGKYSSWSASIANVVRNIDGATRDSQMQYSIGYKFTNNIAVDLTRMDLKEDGNKAAILGVLFYYVYEF